MSFSIKWFIHRLLILPDRPTYTTLSSLNAKRYIPETEGRLFESGKEQKDISRKLSIMYLDSFSTIQKYKTNLLKASTKLKIFMEPHLFNNNHIIFIIPLNRYTLWGWKRNNARTVDPYQFNKEMKNKYLNLVSNQYLSLAY